MSEQDWRVKFATELAYGDSTVVPAGDLPSPSTKSKQSIRTAFAKAKKACNVKSMLEKSKQHNSAGKDGHTKRGKKALGKDANAIQKSPPASSALTKPNQSSVVAKAAGNDQKTTKLKVGAPSSKAPGQPKLATKVTRMKAKIKTSGARLVRKITNSHYVDSSLDTHGRSKSKSAARVTTAESKQKCSDAKVIRKKTAKNPVVKSVSVRSQKKVSSSLENSGKQTVSKPKVVLEKDTKKPSGLKSTRTKTLSQPTLLSVTKGNTLRGTKNTRRPVNDKSPKRLNSSKSLLAKAEIARSATNAVAAQRAAPTSKKSIQKKADVTAKSIHKKADVTAKNHMKSRKVS